MLHKTFLTSLLASGALVLAISTPAQAGKSDRAREAIAAAEAKIHTAETIGASTETPGVTAAARASQVETTVTTQQPSARRSTRTQVIRRTTPPVAAAPSGSVTTTTKVTQP